ncbi:DNA replication regulator SLD2 [Pseudozyma hubeiensis]|nr:DNA replication regulator SLD2 [Pseudozyma hubeiensis]
MEQLLRRELKTWQKAFKAKHGRDPTKRDILADPAIAGTYDTWQAVGGDAKAKSKPRSSGASSTASSSKQRLGENAREEVFKTPSKKRLSSRPDASSTRLTGSPSKNPFRTPTKSQRASAASAVTPGRSRNPFASPTKAPSPEVSPARSLIEVEMTPTKHSPLLDSFSRRNNFMPTKPSPSHPHQQYVASSPSKLRTTLEASISVRRTPTKTAKSRAVDGDAALNAALVAYTPRTKARKRLRGEDVPPTPVATRRVVSAGNLVVKTDPRPVQRGLGAFGFASGRKVSAPASASVFSRARSIVQTKAEKEEEDVDMQDESPVKAMRQLRRAASGFKPLFASPGGNHAPQDVIGAPPAAARRSDGGEEAEDDADAVMDDDRVSPVGGLFAAQVAQRRRARESESPVKAVTGTDVVKKHKIRPALQLPSSSDIDDDDETSLRTGAYASSSPAPYRRRSGASSSPHTDLTIPSSTSRPSSTDHSFLSKPLKSGITSSSPTHSHDLAPAPAARSATDSWRKVHSVELSDSEDPLPQPGHVKTLTITPYQRYGTYTASSPFPSFDEDDTSYALPTSHRVSTSPSLSDDSPPSFAGLKLSPVHLPRRSTNHHLLNSIFDPSTTTKHTFNPEARSGPLQPSASTDDHLNHTSPDDNDDSDDDWHQEVDQDFTFLDSEIDLQDVA